MAVSFRCRLSTTGWSRFLLRGAARIASVRSLLSKAIYLRNVIGISYRKVPRAIEEMFGIRFSPAALIGFEVMLAKKAAHLVDDIAKKLGSSEGAVHADETYWTLWR